MSITVDPTDKIRSAAEVLAAGRQRYLDGCNLGAVQTRHKLNLDEARAAAIVADRLRRARQAEENRPRFRVSAVPADAPIVLKEDAVKRRRGADW